MVHICKPMADIEADYLYVATRPATISQREAARAQALAELRGNYGIPEKDGSFILLGWIAVALKDAMTRDMANEVVRSATASVV